ncbi:MAG TPA: YibE/F family protein [Jiangellaceae bacterium]
MTTHGHGHGGSSADPEIAPQVRTVAAAVVVPFVIAALIAMVILWPSGERPESQAADLTDGEITGFQQCDPIEGEAPDDESQCRMAQVRLDSGADVVAFMPFGEGAPEYVVGDEVVVGAFDTGEQIQYEVIDYQRAQPLLILALIFVAALIILSRWRGLAALAGLAFAIVVLTVFVLPALLDGSSPLAVAVVGAAVIMVGTMYLTHGVSVRTTIALIGTLISLTLTGILGYVFVDAGRFTGVTDEETGYLQFLGIEVESSGLLLAGLVIGALGVLNDVTVTQTVAVWEVAAANRTIDRRGLFSSGMRIGREHVGATVNTLVLAYVGASLSVPMLLIVADQDLVQMLQTEQVAAEIVRALVGSLGIVAAVPITTALAAFAVGSAQERGRRARRARAAVGG